ncbi:MAG: CoA-binding protein [Gammaproteobacteria bacterium]
MDDQAITELLEEVNTIAVIGLSPKQDRPSHRVAKYLQTFSYKVIPVRPAVATILGEDVYKSLEDIPIKVDLVNVFRASKFIPEIVESCIKLGINKIWLQEGIINLDAEKEAQQAGISIVMNRCIYKEIIRLGLDQSSEQ